SASTSESQAQVARSNTAPCRVSSCCSVSNGERRGGCCRARRASRTASTRPNGRCLRTLMRERSRRKISSHTRKSFLGRASLPLSGTSLPSRKWPAPWGRARKRPSVPNALVCRARQHQCAPEKDHQPLTTRKEPDDYETKRECCLEGRAQGWHRHG